METNKFGEGQPVFEKLIKQNRVYVDKTDLVYRMTHDYTFVFLSRPRRFGKSLLCSTLKSYFEADKDLFKGLAIEKLEKDWTKYPVLHFELSDYKGTDTDALESLLDNKISDYEEKYNITPTSPYCNVRLSNLIKKIYDQENQEVVLIIDEYDAPILNVVHDDDKLPVIRQIMRNFYSPIKACAQYLHFVFLTGITKFSQLSIFSELNNLKNISMLPEYAAICGITEQELLSQLSEGIDDMAKARGETREQTINGLKKMYDGYHFAWPSPDVYNPYSIINALSDKKRNSYWIESGASAYLIEMMKKLKVLPTNIGNVKAYADDFDVPSNQIENITPLLYQSGYLTIKKCSPATDRYTLDIPNKEVRDGLMKCLLPYYVTPALKADTKNIIGDMSDLIAEDDMDGALQLLKDFLTGVPYVDFLKSDTAESPTTAKKRKVSDYEGHYQQMLYIIFTLLGCLVYTEVRTATGRIDMTLETATRIYVIELKMNKNVQSALDQIDKNNYTAKYSPHPLPVYKLAITFSTRTRTLDTWHLEPA